MSRFQLKVTHYSPNKEVIKLNLKIQATDAYTKTTEILELFDQDFRVSIMKTFQQAITNVLGTNERVESFNEETVS